MTTKSDTLMSRLNQHRLSYEKCQLFYNLTPILLARMAYLNTQVILLHNVHNDTEWLSVWYYKALG